MEEKYIIISSNEDDEELEKLFEGMSRETARKIANQNSPSKRTPIKKPKVKKTDTKKKK